MRYREVLPDQCPPPESEEIVSEMIVYRAVEHSPPTEADFKSQREERPCAKFRVPECLARGLSVNTDRESLAMAMKLPGLARKKLVCRLTLGRGAGRILHTGAPSHRTWWPYADYAILEHCEVAS